MDGRKGSEHLVEMLVISMDWFFLGQGLDETDSHHGTYFTKLIQQWETSTPTCAELQRSLAGLISMDITHQEMTKKAQSHIIKGWQTWQNLRVFLWQVWDWECTEDCV